MNQTHDCATTKAAAATTTTATATATATSTRRRRRSRNRKNKRTSRQEHRQGAQKPHHGWFLEKSVKLAVVNLQLAKWSHHRPHGIRWLLKWHWHIVLQAGPDDAEEPFQAAVAKLQASLVPCSHVGGGQTPQMVSASQPGRVPTRVWHCPFPSPCWAETLAWKATMDGLDPTLPHQIANDLGSVLIREVNSKIPTKDVHADSNKSSAINGKGNGEQKQTVAACNAWSACIRACQCANNIFSNYLCQDDLQNAGIFGRFHAWLWC